MTAEPSSQDPGTPDELDLVQMAKDLWLVRWRILGLTGAGFLLAIAFAFWLPKKYTSTVLLVPTENQSGNALMGAASLLGKKGGKQGDVELYQALLTSRTVLGQLLRTPMPDWRDSSHGEIRPLLEIMRLDTNNALKVESALNGMAASIKIETDESGSSGIVEVAVVNRRPWLAKQIADAVVQAGQEEIRRVRAERFDAILDRLGEAVKSAEREWDVASTRLATFREANRALSSPFIQRQEDRLRLELESKQQGLLQARSQYQVQLLERERAAPPMVVLDKANLPAKKSGPKRGMIIVVLTFLAGSGAFSFYALLWLLRNAAPSRIRLN